MNTKSKTLRPSPRYARNLELQTLIFGCVLTAAGLLPAAQLTLQHNVTPGAGGGYYQGVTDAWLEYNNEKNYGGQGLLYIGEHVQAVGDSAVVKFDLPAVTSQSIAGATLSLWYADTYQMNYDNTALMIAPYRIKPGYSWFENDKVGTSGYGVNFHHRDAGNSLDWTAHYAGFYDSVDDGNGKPWIKRTGGTVPYAYAPQQWVPFDVRPSVANWYSGAENNGLGFYMQGTVGSDSTADGIFSAKENGLASYGPSLTITYSGAQIAWGGYASAIWDASAANWNVGGYRGRYGDGDFVTFPESASNSGINIASGGVAPGSVTISNNSTRYSFSGGSISGGGGLTKNGAGQATLSASNNYSGHTLIQSGKLIVAANNALGTTGSGTVVSNGAALGLQSVNYSAAEPLTLSGAGVSSSGALFAVSGSNTFAGAIALGSLTTIQADFGSALTLNGSLDGAGFNLNLNVGGSVSVNGPIGGTASTVTKSGAGTLAFGGALANTFTGSTVVNEGSLLLAKLGAPAVPAGLVIGDGFHLGSVVCQAAAQIAPTCVAEVRETSLLDLNGYDATLAMLTLSGGNVQSGAGTLQMNGPVMSTGTQTATLSGHLALNGPQDLGVMSTGPLVLAASVTGGGFNKRGPGLLRFNHTNHFTAAGFIQEGSVMVNNDATLGFGLGPGAITVQAGARLGGIGSLCGPVTIQANATLSPGASVGTLIVSNQISLETGSTLLIEALGPQPAIDVLDLRQGGDLGIAPTARLQLVGALTGSAPYIFARGANSVTGTFKSLPPNEPLPGQPGWFIHYGTHRIYFSRAPQPLVYFRAFTTNSVLLVSWRTGEEIETQSFDLYQWTGAGWQTVNPQPIPAQNPNGAAYLLVNSLPQSSDICQFRLVANTTGGAEIYEYQRVPTEFAFSALPRMVEGGVELRWLSRTDETYDLLATPDLNQPLQLLTSNLPATPPECVFTNWSWVTQGFYRLRLVP